MIKNKKFLEKNNKISDKVNNTIKKELENEPVSNEKYLRTKMKSCEEKKKQHKF